MSGLQPHGSTYIGIMEKKMETNVVYWGIYWSHNIGLTGDSGKWKLL